MPLRRLVVRVRQRQQDRFRERRTHDLQTDWQPRFREAAQDADCREAGHVEGPGIARALRIASYPGRRGRPGFESLSIHPSETKGP